MQLEAGTGRSRRRRAWLTLTLAALTVPAVVVCLLSSPSYRFVWEHDTWVRPVLVVHLLSTAAAVGGGAVMLVRRPANRCGRAAVLLGMIFGGWLCAFFTLAGSGIPIRIAPTLAYSLRPVLFWLVLAFPIGRLDRASRRLYGIYLVANVAAYLLYVVTEYPDDEFGWLRVSTFTTLVQSAHWDVGGLVFGVAVLVVVYRRRLRFRGAGRRITSPAWWAAIVAVGADLVLITTGPLRDLQAHGPGLTPFGMAVQLVDYARWGLVVAVLAIGAWRVWPHDDGRAATVELDADPLDGHLRETLARILGDPTADVALVDTRKGWVDLDGRPRTPPVPERATWIVDESEVVGAFEHDATLAAHPAVIDAAVAAVALQVESARQAGLARAREQELRGLGRELLDAEDAARRGLERDLHDGAQQTLVGLTLQAALLARNSAPRESVTELGRAVIDAGDEIRAMATGRPPALLAERGLEGALGALVMTAGLPVTVEADRCDDLPEPLQRAIWFSATEAVTNAVKHAQASHLWLSLSRDREAVVLTVRDDGTGGLTEPPQSLASRVAGVGGSLEVTSTRAGTTAVARFMVAGVRA